MIRLASLLLALCLMTGDAVADGGALPSPVFAQADGEEAGEEAGEAPPTTVIAPARSFVLDYLIVGALVGVALYAVCRSGQRQ